MRTEWSAKILFRCADTSRRLVSSLFHLRAPTSPYAMPFFTSPVSINIPRTRRAQQGLIYGRINGRQEADRRTKKRGIRVMEISQSRGGNPRDALCKSDCPLHAKSDRNWPSQKRSRLSVPLPGPFSFVPASVIVVGRRVVAPRSRETRISRSHARLMRQRPREEQSSVTRSTSNHPHRSKPRIERLARERRSDRSRILNEQFHLVTQQPYSVGTLFPADFVDSIFHRNM